MAHCSQLGGAVAWTCSTLDTSDEEFLLALPVPLYRCIGFSLLLDPSRTNRTRRVLLWLMLAVQEFLRVPPMLISMGQAQSLCVSCSPWEC